MPPGDVVIPARCEPVLVLVCSDRRRRLADPDKSRLAPRRIGMKDRQTLRFSFVRGWASALLSRSRHKSCYTESRLSTGTRFAGPPVPSLRRLLVGGSCGSHPVRRPGSLSITASCVQTDCFTVTLTAVPDLAFVRAVRASSQASFTPTTRSALKTRWPGLLPRVPH